MTLPFRDSRADTVDPSSAATKVESRVALRWIGFVNRYPVRTEIISAIVVSLLLYLLASTAGISTGSGIATAVLVVLGAFVAGGAPIAITIFFLLRPIRRVLRIAGQATAPSRAPILPFLSETLARMESSLKELQGEGAVLEAYEVAAWVRRCFETATGEYFGTDSHVPSEYRELYADYLAAHGQYLTRLDHLNSFRVLTIEIERLRTDRADNPSDFEQFMEWHAGQPISLSFLPPPTLERITKNLAHADLFQRADLGFWEGNFALLFVPQHDPNRPSQPDRICLRISFAGETLYEECRTYVNLIRDTMTDLLTELPIYPDSLSSNWLAFCNPDERIRQTGPLLEQAIRMVGRDAGDVRILDAAAGVGVEAVHLLKNGYHVTANEIETSLRQAAHEYAKTQDVQIPEAMFTRADWLHMGDQFLSESFDVVYVIGNSLCHLETEAQVAQAVRNFYSILRPGGVLVCDERNFDNILHNWDDIQNDPWNNFRFNSRDNRIMYLGHSIMGAPVERKGRQRVIFNYCRVKRNEGRIAQGELLGSLSMLAFSKGSLKGIIQSAGFDDPQVFCDLEPCDKLSDDADWFTYIAQKPSLGPAVV